MKKTNYFALGAAGLAAISVFLPWLEISSSISYSGNFMGQNMAQSATSSTGGISGILLSGGIFGLPVALIGGFLAFKQIKWAFIAGAVNFLNGLGYMLNWFGTGISSSTRYGDFSAKASGSVNPQIGLYLFVIASLVFVIFTLKNLKSPKVVSASPIILENHITTAPPILNESAPKQQTPNEPFVKQEQSELTVGEKPDTIIEEKNIITQSVKEQQTQDQSELTVGKKPVAIIEEKNIIIESVKEQQTQEQSIKNNFSISKLVLITIAIVGLTTIIILMSNDSIFKEKQLNEQAIDKEKQRIEQIISQVNQSVSDNKYEDALLKVTSINWLFKPGSNEDYVEQYNIQRENLRQTIIQLKNNRDSITIKEAIEKEKHSLQQAINDSINLSFAESVVYPYNAEAIVERAYFFNNPSVNSQRKSYIIRGQVLRVLKDEGEFLFGSFDNNGKITEGWVLKENFKLEQLE